MRKRKKRHIAMLLIWGMITLSSCSRDDNRVTEETSLTAFTSEEQEVVPVIRWAFPDSSFEPDDVEARVNRQLAKDGYPFRLQCMLLETNNYTEKVQDCEADIVYTGLGNGATFYSPAYDAIQKNKYMNLDRYLENSRLYSFFPELLWDTVRYDGSVFCVPNTNFPDTGLTVLFKKSVYSKEEIEQFGETLESLLSFLSQERKLYYGISDAAYLDMYEISNLPFGIYYEDGKIKNLMESELNCKWLRKMNGLVKRGILLDKTIDPVENEEAWAVGLFTTGRATRFQDEDYWKYEYKGDTGDNFAGAIAIRENSPHPDEAFAMLELFLTDKDYGNLIVYGENVKDVDGYAVDAESEAVIFSFMMKQYWGINDGVLKGSMDYYSFDSPKERQDYYDQYIRLADMSYMNYPEQMKKLSKLYDKYADIFLDPDSFEADLNEWKKEAAVIFDTIKQ